MHLHILGIGGTFMSALAILAKEAGYKVTGCDANCYSPVRELLTENHIHWVEGYEDYTLALKADCIVVGNAMKRGMPVVEKILNQHKNYISGPEWLAREVLRKYQVIAVAGTHGKTTTTSMIAHILEHAGFNPGFLIGGVASNFQTSARLGKGNYFVIEADEYDSAFFDKRPKFMHYRPQIAILNNLEFDHADIYPNLAAIQLQFHYFLRTIPNAGIVLKPLQDVALDDVLKQGIFSEVEEFGAQPSAAAWQLAMDEPTTEGQAFQVWYQKAYQEKIQWPLLGQFNAMNGLAAIAASFHAGVAINRACEALVEFKPVKRRMELKYQQDGISIYDDFAHHPTAIYKTIAALKESRRHQRIFVVLEFASYTMKMGVHTQEMGQALSLADQTFILKPSNFNLEDFSQGWTNTYQIIASTQGIVDRLVPQVQAGDAILIMSNRGFDNIHAQIINQLKALQQT